MGKMNKAMLKTAARVNLHGIRIKERVTAIACTNKGEGFVDTALKILISVVVGSLLLAGLYMLFKDTLLPTLTERVVQLFNFSG